MRPAFQVKIKDKWRSLYESHKSKAKKRNALPQHLVEKIEALAKVHPVL